MSGAEGDDVVDASGVTAGSILLTLNGGAGDDTLIDGEIVTDGLLAGDEWLDAHTRWIDDQTVLDVNDKTFTVPEADLVPDTPEAPVA